jgi:hypothetical protein
MSSHNNQSDSQVSEFSEHNVRDDDFNDEDYESEESVVEIAIEKLNNHPQRMDVEESIPQASMIDQLPSKETVIETKSKLDVQPIKTRKLNNVLSNKLEVKNKTKEFIYKASNSRKIYKSKAHNKVETILSIADNKIKNGHSFESFQDNLYNSLSGTLSSKIIPVLDTIISDSVSCMIKMNSVQDIEYFNSMKSKDINVLKNETIDIESKIASYVLEIEKGQSYVNMIEQEIVSRNCYSAIAKKVKVLLLTKQISEIYGL